MKINPDYEGCSDDLLYDLFYGGYIDPSHILEREDDIEEVNDAVETIKRFLQSLEAHPGFDIL